LFSEEFQEACHSTSGAIQETLLHYIQGCQIETKRLEKQHLTILEVGFGLGIGFLTTLEKLNNHQKPWTFISLEIDGNLLEWFRLQHTEHAFLRHLSWKENLGVKILEAKTELGQLTILCGDARKTLPTYIGHLRPKWDAIYQDAFSPKKNPVLWTRQWFELLKQHSQKDVLLSTYSASSSIRKSLLEAGWILSKGEKFGPKRTSTRAALLGQSDPEILLQLSRSPVAALSDDNLP
jgi:tRNA U34 5-methylaminomethyl-2-thiouridine-forming methyltransferase MnmC